MQESLIKYIRSFATTPPTESEIELIKNTFVPKKIRKRQYFLQEGEVCKYTAFGNSYYEFLQHFPQHIIASYPGITKETLSSIRNPVVKK